MSQEASSGGNGGGSGGGSASFLPYLCYGCRRGVLITPSPSPPSEILCPICHGGSRENINRQSVSPTGPPSLVPIKICIDLGVEQGFQYQGRTRSDSNPCVVLQICTKKMSNISTISHIQSILEVTSRESGNLDDYFFGTGFLQFIEHFYGPNGATPASRSAVLNFPLILMTNELFASGIPNCGICMNTFELNEVAKEILPCAHIFHSTCILPWLDEHCTCPLCRLELPRELRLDYVDVNRNTPRGGIPCQAWFRPRTWVEETRVIGAQDHARVVNMGTASGVSISRVIEDRNGDILHENNLNCRFRLPYEVWARAQPALTNNRTGVQNNAGYRVVNVGTMFLPSMAIVIRQISGGMSNEDSYAPRGLIIRIRIPCPASWSRS